MDTVLAARALMGTSLAFHMLYATIGVGLPLMLMVAEGISLRTGNDLYHQMARRWIRPSAVLFAVGAVSGTILSFELGLLWPHFMEFSGPLIGFPFWLEGYAFFTEAIFLGLYLYGEKRLSRRTLFLCTIPMTIGAALSAVFVISANAWMNTPAGFDLQGGVMTNLDPLRAFANLSWPHMAVHGTPAAYVGTAFAMAGVYALAMLRGKRTEYNRKALNLVLVVGTVFLPFMLLSGDWAASFIARHQPAKLAAAEALFETQRGAPLIIGGWPDPATGEVRYAVEIPKLLSLLAFKDPNAEVKGLDAFAPDEIPDPRLVHPFFALMVGSFFIMAAAVAAYWWRRWKQKEIPTGTWLLRGILFAAPFGMIGLQAGWMVTEFGRQPWIIQGVMRVSEAATPNQGIDIIFFVFMAIYFVLTLGLLKLLLRRPPGGKIEGTQEGRRADA